MIDNDNVSINEEVDYEQKGFSFSEIILRHIRKISDICCQEFTGGYWEKKPIKTQSGIMFTETYHPDVREMYCNAVDFLVDIIYPKGDDILKKQLDEHGSKEFTDIKVKLKEKRKMFQQINIMFVRTNFFKTSDSSDE